MDKGLRTISTLIISVVTVAATLMLISTGIYLCRAFGSTSKIEKSYPDFAVLDSVMAGKREMPDKEILRLIIDNQKAISGDRDNILADARQNTNDAIEKITAELNFWVAIIAVLGVLIPIALTFKGEKNGKETIDRYIAQASDKNNTYITHLNYRITQWSEKVDSNREEYDRLKAEINQLRQQLRVEADINSIASVRNNRLLEVNKDLRHAYFVFIEETVQEFIHNFETILSHCSSHLDKEQRWKLIKMTLLLFEVIRHLCLDHSGHTRPRYIHKGEEAVKKLLESLMNSIPNYNSVNEQFRNVRQHVAVILNRVGE